MRIPLTNGVVKKFVKENMGLDCNGLSYERDEEGKAHLRLLILDNEPFESNENLIACDVYSYKHQKYNNFMYIKIYLDRLDFIVKGIFLDDKIYTKPLYTQDGNRIRINTQKDKQIEKKYSKQWQTYLRKLYSKNYDNEVKEYFSCNIAALTKQKEMIEKRMQFYLKQEEILKLGINISKSIHRPIDLEEYTEEYNEIEPSLNYYKHFLRTIYARLNYIKQREEEFTKFANEQNKVKNNDFIL